MLTNQILTTREAAEYLKIHPETLRDYTRRGFIKASIFGNKLRFRTIDLDLYFDRQCVQEETTHAIPKKRFKLLVD